MATEIRLYCICGASISALVPKDLADSSASHVLRVQGRFRLQHSGRGHKLIHRAERLAKQNQETVRLDTDTIGAPNP